jgi:hypothetical protein
MNVLRLSLLGILVLLMAACGGSKSTSSNASTKSQLAKSTVDSVGRFQLPLVGEVFSGNILIDLDVSDADGLTNVSLSFNQQSERFNLCSSNQSCNGNSFSIVKGGINPRDFVEPGTFTLGLWVTDQTNSELQVDSVEIDWQPQTIDGIDISRSDDNQTININWQTNPQLLRYNLYLAAQAGVNQSTYSQLDSGQAVFAISGNEHTFQDLDPSKVYYILLAGIDGSGESAYTQEWVVNVGDNINTAPIAQDDTEVIDEDNQGVFSPLANDTDAQNDPLTLTSVDADTGLATIDGQTIVYQPATNFSGVANLTYIVADTLGLTDTGTILVTINPINDDPLVAGENISTSGGGSINVDVLNNDSDPDGDLLSVISADTTEGTVSIEDDFTLIYQPSMGFEGETEVNYVVSDSNGGTAEGLLVITVSNENIAPTAANDTYTLFANTLLGIDKSGGLLINDTDVNNDLLVVNTTPITLPSSGTLDLDDDGSFTYSPNTDFVGVDSFTYQISDPGLLTDSATVNITVQPIPDVLLGDSLSMTGEFLYIGLGELSVGSGVGTGLYRIGDCIQLIDTYCSMVGDYIESADSGNQPNQMGSYAFTMTYSGTGNSPVQARSVSAGSNVLNFMTVGDALFELYLFPVTGGVIKSVFPDASFSTLFNFGAFIDAAQVCDGLPGGTDCSIGNVGLTAGATDTAPLDRLNFTVSGLATVDISNEPIANDDEFDVLIGESLVVVQPGVLVNDMDADFPIVGDNLIVTNQVNTDFAQPVSLAVDEYRQALYIYNGFSSDISVYDRSGDLLAVFPWPGEGANDADLDIAPEAFTLGSTEVPQGSLLVFNGETAETEIYAIDQGTGAQLTTLNTAFGNSHVVGGAYNPVTNSFFLLQDNVPGAVNGNLVAEIDPANGEILSSFSINADSSLFNVSFGDLDVNNVTGNLYLVSSLDSRLIELTPNGNLVRYISLPAEVSGPSGIAVNNEADRVWFVNNTSSSPILEVDFANQGNFPSLVSTLVSQAQNGFVSLNLDGSFTYTPNAGFIGEDNFIYQSADQTGKAAQGKVLLKVE